LITTVTIVACTFVSIIGTFFDYLHTDIYIIFNLVFAFANLVAFATGLSLLLAVADCRAAQVINDFNLRFLAIATRTRALLVYAVLNGLHAYICILC